MKPSKTILVVEDEGFLREAIAYDLTLQGYEVLEATNGRTALEIIDRQLPDLVVSDIRMPEMSGIELLKELRRRDPFLPVVIFLTGYADLSREEALALGADAVFTKPFDRRELFKTIERMLVAPEIRWSQPLAETKPMHSVRGTIQAEQLGRCGFHLQTFEPAQPSGELVNFEVWIEKTLIRGVGVVRWTRTDGLQAIEFIYLEPDSLKWISKKIRESAPSAAIPLPRAA